MSAGTSRAVLERRDELAGLVAEILATEEGGRLTAAHESAAVDFKEEAGRRSGKLLEPGSPQNRQAATQLADEVACLANSPGGGALILGVEDKTGTLLGTELAVDWLRSRINEQVGVAPEITEHFTGGQRVLAIYVAESPEPVPDTGDKLRWRVGDSCATVDRSEWWQHRSSALSLDPMAVASRATLDDVQAGAVAAARFFNEELQELTDEDALRQLGALRTDGHLTEAGRLLFCAGSDAYLELTVVDVPGGSVLNRVTPSSGQSLLQQLRDIEAALDAINHFVTIERGMAHHQTRLVPKVATREAILNGLIHRDWNRRSPTEVRWNELDSMMEVRSPGGFPDGVSESNVLSQRNARYPALADLFRALGLVEKQGLGVDRMYQSMIVLGHRPPTIRATAGPSVTTTLVGGEPLIPIMELVAGIRPTPRQRDSRVAILLYGLLHHPFLTEETAAELLQTDLDGTLVALRATYQSTFRDRPLIRPYKDVWLLGDLAWKFVVEGKSGADQYLAHAGPGDALSIALQAWLSSHPGITSGDLMELSQVSRGTAQTYLQAATAVGDLRQLGQGRSTRYEP